MPDTKLTVYLGLDVYDDDWKHCGHLQPGQYEIVDAISDERGACLIIETPWGNVNVDAYDVDRDEYKAQEAGLIPRDLESQ